MRIDAFGKLLLGATTYTQARGGITTKALVKLTTAESYFEIQAGSTSTSAGLLFSDGNGGNYGLIDYTSTDHMLFYTAAGERMRIQANGNVGIGTTSPASGIKLDVSGSVSVAGAEGLRLGNVGDHGAYDNIKITYSGYNGGSPEVIFTPRTTPGSGALTTFFRFKNSNGTAANNNLASVSIDNDLTVGGDMTVDGIITAKEFHTTFVSASIIYQSGSTQFGDSTDDTHIFTGNVSIGTTLDQQTFLYR
jgi:hypothetical protein